MQNRRSNPTWIHSVLKFPLHFYTFFQKFVYVLDNKHRMRVCLERGGNRNVVFNDHSVLEKTVEKIWTECLWTSSTRLATCLQAASFRPPVVH